MNHEISKRPVNWGRGKGARLKGRVPAPVFFQPAA